MTKLSTIQLGKKFSFCGDIYEIDPYGTYGNRQIPVVNISTKEKLKLSIKTDVEIVQDDTLSSDPKPVDTDISSISNEVITEPKETVKENNSDNSVKTFNNLFPKPLRFNQEN